MSRIARALFAALLFVVFLAPPATALRDSGGRATSPAANVAEAEAPGPLAGLWNWIQSLFDEEHGTIIPKP